MDDMLWRDSCVSSTQLKKHIWNKQSLVHLEKYLSCRKYSIAKLSQFSEANSALDAPASNIDGFLHRDTSVSSISLSMSIWSKQSLSLP
jgi:hypothetical protein